MQLFLAFDVVTLDDKGRPELWRLLIHFVKVKRGHFLEVRAKELFNEVLDLCHEVVRPKAPDDAQSEQIWVDSHRFQVDLLLYLFHTHVKLIMLGNADHNRLCYLHLVLHVILPNFASTIDKRRSKRIIRIFSKSVFIAWFLVIFGCILGKPFIPLLLILDLLFILQPRSWHHPRHILFNLFMQMLFFTPLLH